MVSWIFLTLQVRVSFNWLFFVKVIHKFLEKDGPQKTKNKNETIDLI
jgi:hypothetical protein